mmetsp:Transcript_37297/g.93681  ORF Transcript_37297/g.93681 Transcript_37297/m.93681 type:complete len:532 (+) Transcript_37297:159-1754(+)
MAQLPSIRTLLSPAPDEEQHPSSTFGTKSSSSSSSALYPAACTNLHSTMSSSPEPRGTSPFPSSSSVTKTFFHGEPRPNSAFVMTRPHLEPSTLPQHQASSFSGSSSASPPPSVSASTAQSSLGQVSQSNSLASCAEILATLNVRERSLSPVGMNAGAPASSQQHPSCMSIHPMRMLAVSTETRASSPFSDRTTPHPIEPHSWGAAAHGGTFSPSGYRADAILSPQSGSRSPVGIASSLGFTRPNTVPSVLSSNIHRNNLSDTPSPPSSPSTSYMSCDEESDADEGSDSSDCSSSQSSKKKKKSKSKTHRGDKKKKKKSSLSKILSRDSLMDAARKKKSQNRKKKRKRRPTTDEQLAVLNEAFLKDDNPPRAVKLELGRQAGMDLKRVQVWFQNRRAKERREKAHEFQQKHRHYQQQQQQQVFMQQHQTSMYGPPQSQFMLSVAQNHHELPSLVHAVQPHSAAGSTAALLSSLPVALAHPHQQHGSQSHLDTQQQQQQQQHGHAYASPFSLAASSASTTASTASSWQHFRR